MVNAEIEQEITPMEDEFSDAEIDIKTFTKSEQQEILDAVKAFFADPANFEDDVMEEAEDAPEV